MTDYTALVLSLTAIAWCIWGIWVWSEIEKEASGCGWKIFLFTMAGPCVWAIGALRGLAAIKHNILHKAQLPCGCKHHL